MKTSRNFLSDVLVRMSRRFGVVIPAASVWLAASATATAQNIVNNPGLSVSTYATGLTQPTGFAFLPGSGNLLAIEKESGQVRSISNGTVGAPVLDLPVNSASERGLLGIAVDPDFITNRHVYLYYSLSTTTVDTSGESEWSQNRLSRFTMNQAGTQLTGETILGTFGTNADGQDDGPNHDGGPLRFGPDSKLYGVTGDLNRDRAEQNQQTQSGNSAFTGGIYRLNTDGTVPNDNPFSSHSQSTFHQWYAYGVRNSFGLAFDPVNGALWETENGPNNYDEVNRVAPGFNSGWSHLMGPDSRDPQGTGDLVNLTASSTYSDPEYSWLNPIAVTAIEFLSDSFLAGYSDGVLVGDASNGQIYLFRLNAGRDGFTLTDGNADLVADNLTERNALLFGQGFGTVTDIQVGPDGAVYVASLANGSIYRVIPEPSTTFLILAGCMGLIAQRRSRSPASRPL